jgi:protein-S-isoprenylcysteine O-methyltransferase Ste14
MNSALLIFLPYILINLLDIYFLSKSLIRRPKSIDMRFSSIVISSLVSIHPIFIILLPVNVSRISLFSNTGLIINFVGGFIILWALLALRANLTVLPEVNAIVRTGPYKYIRHPLYFSYIFLAISEFLIYQTPAVLLITVLQISLILVRAAREEALLLEVPEYRDYYNQTLWFTMLWDRNHQVN